MISVRAALLIILCLGGPGGTVKSADLRTGVSLVSGNVPRLQRWEQYIGSGTGYIADTLPADHWVNLTEYGLDFFLSKYQGFPRKERFEIGIPLFADRDDTDRLYKEQPERWEMAARGDFDLHFTRVAQKLVAKGFGKAYLRPGWELNGNWFTWGLDQGLPELRGQRAQYFATYWQRIHRAMMAVPGAEFKWLWNVSIGYEPDEFDCTQAWPGDEYVDFVSADIYDAHGEYYWTHYYDQQNQWPLETLRDWAWKAMVEGVHTNLGTGKPDREVSGLDFYRSYARQRGKGFIISEWGLWDHKVIKTLKPLSYVKSDIFGSGDNPSFIERMHDWIQKNDVHAAAYFNVRYVGGQIDHALTDEGLGVSSHPLSQKRFRELFAVQGVSPSVAASPVSIYFADDFDTSRAAAWKLSPGQWRIGGEGEDKQLQVRATSAPAEAHAPALRSGSYTVHLRPQITTPGGILGVILLRSAGAQYRLDLVADMAGRLRECRLLAGDREVARQRVPASVAVDLQKQRPLVSVRVVPQGEGLLFECRVFDRVALSYLEKRPISLAGGCGLWAGAGVSAAVDDFFIFPND